MDGLDDRPLSRWRTRFKLVVENLLSLERNQKAFAIFTADAILCVAAIFIAFSLRVGALAFPVGPVLKYAAVAVPLFIPAFYFAGAYRTIFRFVGGRTLLDLARATFIYAIPLIMIFLVISVPNVPRTVAVLQPMIFYGLVVSSRILVRYFVTEIVMRSSQSRAVSRVIIYGAGRSGQQLANSLKHEYDFAVVAFVDDDGRLQGSRLDGVPIIHSSELVGYAKKRLVDAVLIALPKVSRKRRAEIVDDLRELNLRVQALPAVGEIVGGKVSINDLRDVQIEDLLGRDEVQPNEILFARTILGKNVLVTGAGGTIGGEICRQIVCRGAHTVVLFDMSEFGLYQIERELRNTQSLQPGSADTRIVAVLGSVTDRNRVGQILEQWSIDTIYHAAAYKHVPLVEENPVEGLRNNILGTLVVVEEARRAGVNDMTLVSTDKAVRPTNVMGASKRISELIVQAAAREAGRPCYSIVRFGNVLGSSGSVVPLFRHQIELGGPITLTHRDVMRYFMTIPEASQLVIQAAGLAKGGEVFVLDMGEAISIYSLAHSMVQLSGLTVRDEINPSGDIEIVDVGLRPGEKLIEELLIGNDPKRTAHPRIKMAREKEVTTLALQPLLELLVKGRGFSEILPRLQELVPEFAHNRDNALPAKNWGASDAKGSE